MDRDFKTEGNIIYPDKTMLTWGPFYFHSVEKAKKKMSEVLEWIIEWVNEKDNTLNIQPENVVETSDGKQIVFDIQAWKNNTTLVRCDGIISVDDINFED